MFHVEHTRQRDIYIINNVEKNDRNVFMGSVAEYAFFCEKEIVIIKRGGRLSFLSTLCPVSASKARVFLLFFL